MGAICAVRPSRPSRPYFIQVPNAFAPVRYKASIACDKGSLPLRTAKSMVYRRATIHCGRAGSDPALGGATAAQRRYGR